MQGVLLSVPETMPTLVNMKRLWVHEILRVYGDRLVDETDTNWLINQLHITVQNRMEIDMDHMFSDLTAEKKGPVRFGFIVPPQIKSILRFFKEKNHYYTF